MGRGGTCAHAYLCLGGTVLAIQVTLPSPASPKTSPFGPSFCATVVARSPLRLPLCNTAWLPWEQRGAGGDILGPVGYLHLSLIL